MDGRACMDGWTDGGMLNILLYGQDIRDGTVVMCPCPRQLPRHHGRPRVPTMPSQVITIFVIRWKRTKRIYFRGYNYSDES